MTCKQASVVRHLRPRVGLHRDACHLELVGKRRHGILWHTHAGHMVGGWEAQATSCSQVSTAPSPHRMQPFTPAPLNVLRTLHPSHHARHPPPSTIHPPSHSPYTPSARHPHLQDLMLAPADPSLHLVRHAIVPNCLLSQLGELILCGEGRRTERRLALLGGRIGIRTLSNANDGQVVALTVFEESALLGRVPVRSRKSEGKKSEERPSA